ncbi:transposase [Myroides marinus]|nr:transposase [Myroides marinus]
MLFQQYPVLKQAYSLSQQLRTIYNSTTVKEVGYTKLARWYNDVQNIGLNQFNTVMNTMKINYKTILNYFDNRSTNASAESFNAKIKAFRAQFRGVRNIDFFLYRLAKLYA